MRLLILYESIFVHVLSPFYHRKIFFGPLIVESNFQHVFLHLTDEKYRLSINEGTLSSKKINYPSADRNKSHILEVLLKHFDKNIDGKVLEISSGTGQHAAYFAAHFPRLTFQPSEHDTSLFDSIKAYADSSPTKNVKDPIRLDVLDDWKAMPNDFDYAINVNMIHVTPFSCSVGLFKNVSARLKPGGLLVTYGAYANNGVLEPQSNRDFDRSIRAKDPQCGVRDIQDLIKVAEQYRIKLVCVYDLPANNKCLIWQKSVT